MASRLKVVDGRPKPPVRRAQKSITMAAMDGKPREVLVALRDRVAKAVEAEDTPARDLAALSKRLMDIMREIEAIDEREDSSTERSSGGGSDYEAFDPEAI